MTPDSLTKAVRSYWLATLAALAPLMVLLLLHVSNSRWLSEQLALAGFQVEWQTVRLGLLLVEILLVFAAIIAVRKGVLPRCPVCGVTFTPFGTGTIIRTKRCPRCGAIVIAESTGGDHSRLERAPSLPRHNVDRETERARDDLADAFDQMSDAELIERWTGGYLTEAAIAAAWQELSRRGVTPPPYIARDPNVQPPDEPASASGLQQVLQVLSPGEQVPVEYIEVARSGHDGDLDSAARRLGVEGIPYRAVYDARSRQDGGPVIKPLVPPQFAAGAREIIALVNSGAFSLSDDEIPGA